MRSLSGREPSVEILCPRNVTSGARKTHFVGLMRMPFDSSLSKMVRR
jgi:hypothetical protein